MDFSTAKDAAMLALMFLVFGAPALAIAARIAVRPVLDAIASWRESLAATQPQIPDARVAALEAEVTHLSQEVRRLAEAEAFTRQLVQGNRDTDTLRSHED